MIPCSKNLKIIEYIFKINAKKMLRPTVVQQFVAFGLRLVVARIQSNFKIAYFSALLRSSREERIFSLLVSESENM